ncbi:MAG: 2-phosphosulfolactate phosphatase [Gemmatimonadota bacterium]
MRLDIVFTPLGLNSMETAGRTVFVIDILRATTTMCSALNHGAKAIIPVSDTEEALKLKQTLGGDVLLAGEQNCERIKGFDLGNTPAEMTEEVVRGKLLVFRTTNGTRALLGIPSAAGVYVASAANITLAGQRAQEVLERDKDLLILCGGRENSFSLDDAYCAGRLAVAAMGGRRRAKGLNDSALACLDLVRRYGDRWDRPLRASRAGRELLSLGFGDDVADCARPDAYPVLAQYHERRVTAVSPSI